MALRLAKSGHPNDAEELIEVAEVLKEVKEGASKEEVKSKGFFQNLKHIAKDIWDKNSPLHKTVEGLRR